MVCIQKENVRIVLCYFSFKNLIQITIDKPNVITSKLIEISLS